MNTNNPGSDYLASDKLSSNHLKVLMAGGGSGGHIYPAISIADCIAKRFRKAEIAFIGTSRGLENRLIPQAGYHVYHIESRGLQKGFSPSNILALYYYFTSPLKAKKLIESFSPDICIGTGAYLSYPLIKAASRLGVPCALHESNAYPGKAVLMLEKYVDRIYTNFEVTSSYLKYPEKALCVGNPLTGKEIPSDKQMCRRAVGIPDNIQYTILSFGGSLGARRLNSEIISLWKTYTSRHREIFHIHVAGKTDYERCMSVFEEEKLSRCPNLRLVEYLYDMPLWEGAADAVISRAGAMTLSELASGGIPSILVPSPNVAYNHQYKNAMALSDAGAARVITENELSSSSLLSALRDILYNKEYRHSLSENIRSFSRPDAASAIIDDIEVLLSKELLSLLSSGK